MSQSTMTGSEPSHPFASPPVSSETTQDDGPQPKTPHSKYYFDDIPVIFEVEGGVLFKVHKHFLQRESPVFQTMFSCPPDSTGPEGRTDDKPIVLPDVKPEELEALLDYFYEPARSLDDALPANWAVKKDGRKKKGGGATKRTSTTDHLKSLLSISTRFDFEKARRLAVEGIGRRLNELTPVERVILARQFDVDPWLKPAYVDLCKRDEPLSIDEAERLGLATTVLMARARESFVQEKAEPMRSRRSPSPTPFRTGRAYSPSPPRVWRDPLDIAAERIVSSIFFPEPVLTVEEAVSD